MTNSMEIMVQTDYFQSYQLKEQVTYDIHNLAEILNFYKSEENILNGNSVFLSEDNLPWDIRFEYEDYEDEYRNKYPDASDKEIFDTFLEANSSELEAYKTSRINSDLNTYKSIINQLNNSGVYYYINSDEITFTNAPEFKKENFINSKVYYIFDETGISTSFDEFNPILHGIHALDHYPQDTLFLSYNQDVLEDQARVWRFEQGKFKPSIAIMFSLFMILLTGLAYIGFNYQDDYFPWIKNNWYFDIRIVLYLSLITILQSIALEYFTMIGLYYTIPASIITGLLTINLYISIVKHYNEKNFLRSNLSYVILAKIFGFIGLSFTKLPTMVRMFPTPYKARDLNRIMTGVNAITEGDLDHIIETKSRGLYRTLGRDINSITDGLKAAVQNELKSERLRTELISNVSHDIRTPLTSIITYVDLIKRSDDSQEIKEYLTIIDQKSQRLKNLTDDLFEASKVSSGSLNVQVQPLDLQAFLSQCLGELSEKMTTSGLEFIMSYHHKHKMVLIDGNLMFRVIENLMSNILKYSLKGSRVYINIEEEEDELLLVFKNISAHPLNVNPDELFERFTRGDDSRTTEGSGLGLSITEKLVNLQDGNTKLDIDGDLFKVTVHLKKAIS